MITQGCVRIERKPVSLEQVDSAMLVLQVDSAAIYRCDTCAFAVSYRRQTTGKVKPCASCDWVSLVKPKHNKGDVPELSNQPVNALHEQDALQHRTESLVVPESDSGDTPKKEKPVGEAVANRRLKPVNAHSGDGL